MEDEADKEAPPADFNKIDLTQLQGFSFGTQWTQDKASPGRSDFRERPRREARHDDGGGGAPNRKDRRSFHRPSGEGAPAGGGPRGGDRAPGEFRGGPRRSDGPGGGYEGGPRRRGPEREAPPYISPHFAVTFYPEDASFGALVKTIRASCRTIELFEIARTVLAKPERFTVLVGRRAPERPGAEGAAPAEPSAARASLYVAVPDGVPFESEEAAVAHVMSRHLGLFYDQAEVEIEPPKGNFQVVNRCTVTGELLGPPNYHRYSQIVQQHHAEKIDRMPLEAYRSRIESVRDPEVIKQWLEKMKKATRYTWKSAARPEPAAAAPAQAPAAEAAPSAEETPPPADAPPPTVVPPAEGTPASEAAAPAPAPAPAPEPAAPAAPSAVAFDSAEEAKAHLLAQARDRVVRTVTQARFHGRLLGNLPEGEIHRAVEGEWERQKRFPLDTANGLRGRLRREHFTIFKKGSKGVSYVCAVKRKFRVPGQAFAESIGGLISFIETNPLVKAGELPAKILDLPAPPAAGAEAPALTPEQREKAAKLYGDLRWLVGEGYVTEFIDGALYAPPAMVESCKKEIESEEQDPENFPEAPPPEADLPAPEPPAEAPVPAAEAPPEAPAEAAPAAEPSAEPPAS